MPKRTLQGDLIAMKQTVIDQCLAKQIKDKDGAKLLNIHPKSFSRLKHRYQQHGIEAIVPKKPGPKARSAPPNRTKQAVEELVVALARANPQLGPQPLADLFFDTNSIILDQTTVWRILKRHKVRYTTEYKRWKQDPQLYCLETPGLELQMDACYPFGRARRLVEFDAIDDCSRYVAGRIFHHETTLNAIAFVDYLLERVPFRIQRIRVDNRYGKKFVEYCATKGIEVIANDPYSPEQNGKIERFHKTVKRECYWRYCSFYDSKEQLEYKLQQWLTIYNSKRRHSGFGMHRLTPAQKLALSLLNGISRFYPQKVTLSLQQYIF